MTASRHFGQVVGRGTEGVGGVGGGAGRASRQPARTSVSAAVKTAATIASGAMAHFATHAAWRTKSGRRLGPASS
jgi:hypothetical protein